MAATAVQQAREAYARQAWRQALELYGAVADDARLGLDDIERHAVAAHLTGEERDSRDALTRGYRRALELGDLTRAARFAFFLGHGMIFSGETGQANGWFGQARELLAGLGADCVEWGYLMIPAGVDAMAAGEFESARATFEEARAIGRRFADGTLRAMAGHGLGRASIALGLVNEGMNVLDEVMVAVAAGDVSPLVVGHIYCGVLEACQEVFDVRRAREWTAVFSRWCEGQPDLVPYRGPCLVHRVELMRLRGDWEDALQEARRACDWLSLPASPEGPGDAFYLLGELCRLRGDVPGAERAYQQASRLGRRPQPGLALLWLAHGRTEEAMRAIRLVIDEPEPSGSLGDWERMLERARRAELYGACVEIHLARGEVALAREASDRLAEAAAAFDALPLRALADRAEGSVLIAEGDPRAALAPLRRSWTVWQRLEAPYEAARVRVLIGEAFRALGDAESAAMEFDAARWAFERLGAAPDLARLEGSAPEDRAPGGLTPREVEVLRLIAAGETNKAIAAALVISEHTVARHVQNMLQKLGFSSRTSLGIYAVQQGLARPGNRQE
jgi:DNA-binding CsgD family transcriptional regulator